MEVMWVRENQTGTSMLFSMFSANYCQSKLKTAVSMAKNHTYLLRDVYRDGRGEGGKKFYSEE